MRILLPLLIFFVVAQLLGIFTASIIYADYEDNPYVQGLYLKPEGESESFFTIIFLFAIILLSTAFLLFLIKYYKGNFLFLILEFFMISVPSSIIFYSFSRIIFPYLESILIGILLGCILAILKHKYSFFKNPSAILASAAVGAIFGISFSPFFIIIFLIILAIYDYIAVFKTKHMVSLAGEIMKRDMALTISSKVTIPKIGEKRIDLGTGDILAPIMLEVSFLSINPTASIFIFFGSTISVFLIFYLLRKSKMIIPALPPIVAGILLSLFIGYITGFIYF
ncbi:MAG: presenilin family intramembrane aspartyl protease [Candidatus ainarchaeum sp.]|nr:presenilin family intramembrane aspartyl protease [Candidatus ainarchaeum sp.]